MNTLAVNVGFLFRELPYLERFRAARDAGFEAVEFAWPLAPPAEVVSAVRAAGVRVVLLNVNAGDLEAGERGHANDPDARERWRNDFEEALRLAEVVDCPALNVLPGNRLDELALDVQLDCVRENLLWALPKARAAGRTLLLELLNPSDTPRYLLTKPADVVALLEEFDDPSLRLQFDAYHFGRVLGADRVPGAFRELAPLVGHVQVADAPGRHEPGTGTIDWPAFFRVVAETGYRGAIGLEYAPQAGTSEGLRLTSLILDP
jgi:hydroxypyruvate isomerase